MSINIKLHRNDLPDDLDLGNVIAVDGEFMGLNVRRDPLCLIQISSGNSDALTKSSATFSIRGPFASSKTFSIASKSIENRFEFFCGFLATIFENLEI